MQRAVSLYGCECCNLMSVIDLEIFLIVVKIFIHVSLCYYAFDVENHKVFAFAIHLCSSFGLQTKQE